MIIVIFLVSTTALSGLHAVQGPELGGQGRSLGGLPTFA